MKRIDRLLIQAKQLKNNNIHSNPNIIIHCGCNVDNNWIVEEQIYRDENMVLVEGQFSCVPLFYKRCQQIRAIVEQQKFYILSEFRKIADENNFTFSIMPSGIYFMDDFYELDYLEEMKLFCIKHNLIGE